MYVMFVRDGLIIVVNAIGKENKFIGGIYVAIIVKIILLRHSQLQISLRLAIVVTCALLMGKGSEEALCESTFDDIDLV